MATACRACHHAACPNSISLYVRLPGSLELWAKVRFGSIAPFRPSARHFRSAPINGHQRTCPGSPVRANGRLTRTQNDRPIAVVRRSPAIGGPLGIGDDGANFAALIIPPCYVLNSSSMGRRGLGFAARSATPKRKTNVGSQPRASPNLASADPKLSALPSIASRSMHSTG